MLKTHMDAKERHLLATSQVPASAGHPLHKGTPREAFIREFLEDHLSERVAIGTGEIIDFSSRPNQSRNQIDIIIYKRDYPRLVFGGDIHGFLVESVVATIEVKSTLDEKAIFQSTKATRNIKSLKPSIVKSFSAGFQPPSILSFVVAYEGPAKMATIHPWITNAATELGFTYPAMPPNGDERCKTANPGLDAVFVLGKGFIHFDTLPVGFITDQTREKFPDGKWAIANSQNGNLLLLFIILTVAVSGVAGSWLNALPYLSRFSVSKLVLRP